ncbi:MAG: hypothetical protein MUE61_09545 [Vicinamibacterales bacterium]|nr:hypothetical protein [Vicinamibacterales bacterium]
MFPVKVGSTFAVTRWRAAVALFSLGFALLSAQPGEAQPGPLKFFKNYFITGDYAVGGASLWQEGAADGKATVQISVPDVPEGVDILAAYLYVQTAETVQWSGIHRAKVNGADLGPGSSSLAKALNWDLATAPCWSVGWPGGRRMVTYRADVLRFLPVGPDGKLVVGRVDGTNILPAVQVEVPDSGTAFGDVDEGGTESGGGTGPRAVGASLVVVYRDPTKPFKAIVIYDGGFTKSAFSTMNQTIAGFYQASATPAAKMTHIVGDGRPYVSEKVLFDGQVIATNPFFSAEGPKWDNPTFPLTATPLPLPAGAASVAVKVAPNGLLSDCLCYSGIVLSTEVQDSDKDGLLDVWESSTTTLYDPNGQPLPNLAAMGANKDVKDLFIEIGYMKIDAETSYGGVLKPAHTHLPTPAALKLMGDAFAKELINVHFDVGGGYSAGEASAYVIPAGLARGGEAIDETATVCPPGGPDQPWVCQFSEYPGTVGWKTGFRFLRDQVFSVTPTPPVTNPPTPIEDYCGVPGYTCDTRFDRNRKDMFRYALFAHALGLPKSEDPTDPGFHVPRTNTGVGDFPGADVMVTLGAFADTDGLPVGTPFMQASTLMHELGHNMERRHGGEAFEPNCKPTYLSVMNYLYQLRGLLDDSGKPNLDFSGSTSGGISEASLSDGPWGGFRYRIGWYAPLTGSYLDPLLGGRGTAALRHCDGSDVLATDVPMVRIDARTAAGEIDWNADGDSTETPFSLDINFNGRIDASLNSSNDWSSILLNQIGARRNTGGVYADPDGYLFVGPLSLDSGRGDLGRGDLGRGDLGRGDLGRGDLGRGDLGRGDLGRGDLGRGDLGRGDLGRGDLGRGDLGGGDLFVGDPDSPGGELDFETATELAKTPPNEFTATIATDGVLASWKAPNIGGVTDYFVYRVPGNELGQAWQPVTGPITEVPPGTYTLVDGLAGYGEVYTYFAVAAYGDGVQSDPSNLVTLTTPKASSTVTVTCPSSVSYTGSALTPCSATVTGPGLNQTAALVYENNINAGTATASYTFEGNANYEGSFGQATFEIVPAISTVTVSCPASVTYDGTAQTPCTATVTGAGGLNQTAALVYENNINAGVASASYIFAADANYAGSTGSAHFTIDQASPTVTVTCPASVTYDGTAQTPCTATVTGAGGLNQTPAPTYVGNTDAGTASASYTFAGDTNYAGSTGSANFTIGLAASTTTVTCGPGVPYNAAAQTPCTVAVTGPGGLSLAPAPNYSNNLNAGTASASYTYAGDANYAGSAGTGSFTIPKAPSAVTVACTPSVIYTGQPQAPCAAQATGVGMSPVDVSASLVYTGNINAGTAGATATYAGDANHDGSSGAGGFAIAKATPVFSGLSGPAISAGTTPTALAGTLKSGTLIPSGSVSITLNGVTQSAPITATGAFSSSFVTGALTTTGSPYTITYSYTGDTNFTAAGPDTSKGLTVKAVGYALLNVKNLPPAAGVTFKPSSTGTLVDLEWKFTTNGAVVNSADARPTVTITGPGGYSKILSGGGGNDCSNFEYKTKDNKWDVHWQPRNAAVGTYYVVVTSQKTGQRFPETGPGYPVVFK